MLEATTVIVRTVFHEDERRLEIPTMPTYLTFVFRDYGEDAWHSESALLFDEDHVTQEMVTLGISTTPGRKERRLHFKLSHPLTPIQWSELTLLKEGGMFSSFFVSDEAPEETQPVLENDHVPTDEKVPLPMWETTSGRSHGR